MKTLWFIVPAAGRIDIATVCLRQLRRTCDTLTANGVLSSAVVVADDENLDLARGNGFATVERDNTQLGRRINDGYELAGRAGVDYMVPLGNDDWIHPNWISLPRRGEIVCTHLSTVVNEDCTRMARLNITYPGGDGVRVYPRDVLERVGFRPAGEDRARAIDTATHHGLSGAEPRYVYRDVDPLFIVDFKSSENLNDYEGCVRSFGRKGETSDVWGELGSLYPAEAIEEMRALHAVAVAA